MAESVMGVNAQQVDAASVAQKVKTQLAEARAFVNQQERAKEPAVEKTVFQQAQQVQPSEKVHGETTQAAPSAMSVQPTSAAEVSLTDNARIYTIEQKVNNNHRLTTDEMNYIRTNDTDLYEKAQREEELLAAEETRTAVRATPQIR